MDFRVSGVHCAWWIPPAASFFIALLTTPGGISGAVLLLPFQVSVLGFTSPAVTPTNLVYNLVAAPGAVWRFLREGRMDWPLARTILGGTIPGILVGVVIRLRYLPELLHVKLFTAVVLLALGVRLLRDAARAAASRGVLPHPRALLAAASFAVGVIGGIYGVGGGAFVAPFAITMLGLPAKTVAGPALLGTFVASLAGVAFFEFLGRASLVSGIDARPDWVLGLLFGIGGLAGAYCGARLQKYWNERWIRCVLGVILTGIALHYFAAAASAQCLVVNPGGSRLNPNRPSDADVPAAAFSPLSPLNREIPKWLCFTAGYRARLESYSAGNFLDGNSDAYLLTRFRLGLAVTPSPWLKAYVELQDATAFWKTGPLRPPYQSTWDLRRAYLDFGDLERSPIAVRVGRQDLAFGYLRLVGTAYWRNASRGYDAAMAVVNWKRLRASVWAASPVICLENGLSHHEQGNNFHGVYTVWKDIVPSSTLEPYALWRLSPGFRTEAGAPARLNEKTIGARWAGNAAQFDYDAEIAMQNGSLGPDRLRAWGWSLIAGYTVRTGRLRTRFFAKYDYASGDRNPEDGVRGTFDQLYPNIHDHHGLADQVAWQNLKSLRAGARVAVRRNWMLSAAYNDWSLASASDAFYNASGVPVARDPTGRSGVHIGYELDAQTSLRLTRQLEFGAGIGHIRSGDFLLRTGHARAYTYPYVLVQYDLN